jgi:hypothetical protein
VSKLAAVVGPDTILSKCHEGGTLFFEQNEFGKLKSISVSSEQLYSGRRGGALW